MEFRRRLFKVVLATVIGMVAMVGSEDQGKAAEYLCTTFPKACEYAPQEAPVLGSDVCYDLSTGTVTLKGGGACPGGTWDFYVDRGEVIDPQTGEIVAYIALPDACDLGYCLPYAGGGGQPGAMCCDPQDGSCVTTEDICPPDKIAVWCQDGEVPQQGNNGEWECHEA